MTADKEAVLDHSKTSAIRHAVAARSSNRLDFQCITRTVATRLHKDHSRNFAACGGDRDRCEFRSRRRARGCIGLSKFASSPSRTLSNFVDENRVNCAASVSCPNLAQSERRFSRKPIMAIGWPSRGGRCVPTARSRRHVHQPWRPC